MTYMKRLVIILLASVFLFTVSAYADDKTQQDNEPTVTQIEVFLNAVLATQADMSIKPPQLIQASCCKICVKGKACGNSCIKKTYNCSKPPGCACDGY